MLQRLTPLVPKQPCEVCTIIVPILPMGELRQWEREYLDQGHTVGKWWHQNGNPMAHLLIHPLHSPGLRFLVYRIRGWRLLWRLLFFFIIGRSTNAWPSFPHNNNQVKLSSSWPPAHHSQPSSLPDISGMTSAGIIHPSTNSKVLSSRPDISLSSLT